MSSYLLILRRDQSNDLGMPYEEMFTRFRDFTIGLHQSGALKSFERLKAGSEGKTLHGSGGITSLTGPYGGSDGATGSDGTHESVIGFYLVEAADEEEALKMARECPILRVGGSVEIRETEIFPGQ